MWLRRLTRDFKELRRVVSELVGAPGPEEEAASFELAVSARRFSDTTKSVVDDKLSFSATLMRAGEVEAANRLVAEVEQEVVAEEAALIERVNEVKVAQAIRRERLTRMRMARLLATALLGSGLLASSAVAAAVSGMLADRAASQEIATTGPIVRAADKEARTHADGRNAKHDRRVRIAGVRVGLSPSEIRTYRLLTSSGSQEAGLEFLLGILPHEVVKKVESAISTASEAAAAAEEAVEGPRIVEKAKKKAAKAQKAEEEAKEESADPPTDDEEEGSSGNNGNDEGDDEEDEGGVPLPGPDDAGQ